MEQLNKVEIIGYVGSVRRNQLREKVGYSFSVATNYCYRKSDGELVVDTTWHNISYYPKYPIDVKKGDMVHVNGRLRDHKFVGSDGQERKYTEILANSVEVFKESENASGQAPTKNVNLPEPLL